MCDELMRMCVLRVSLGFWVTRSDGSRKGPSVVLADHCFVDYGAL